MTKPIKDAIGKIALPALVLPPGPHVVHNASGAVESVTDAGLVAIEHMARVGCTQETIAAELGMGAKAFVKFLGKADIDPVSAVRLSWEKGFAAHKSDLIRGLTAQAEKGSMIPGIFLLKGLHQLRDQGAQVEVKTSNFIQFLPPEMPISEQMRNMAHAAEQGVMMLPGTMSHEAYLKSLGMTEPDDARTPEKRDEMKRLLLGNPPTPVQLEPTLKDVTPKVEQPEPAAPRSPLGPGQRISDGFNRTSSF